MFFYYKRRICDYLKTHKKFEKSILFNSYSYKFHIHLNNILVLKEPALK